MRFTHATASQETPCPPDPTPDNSNDLSLKCRMRSLGSGSAARDERHHDVGSVAVEVLSSTVVDGGRARVGVPGGDLDVAQRHAGVEGRHDERGSQHVRVHGAKPGALANSVDPPVRGAPVEALAVTAP